MGLILDCENLDTAEIRDKIVRASRQTFRHKESINIPFIHMPVCLTCGTFDTGEALADSF